MVQLKIFRQEYRGLYVIKCPKNQTTHNLFHRKRCKLASFALLTLKLIRCLSSTKRWIIQPRTHMVQPKATHLTSNIVKPVASKHCSKRFIPQLPPRSKVLVLLAPCNNYNKMASLMTQLKRSLSSHVLFL